MSEETGTGARTKPERARAELLALAAAWRKRARRLKRRELYASATSFETAARELELEVGSWKIEDGKRKMKGEG